MRVLLVSIDLEYSLAYAYLRACVGARTGLARRVDLEVLCLDARRLNGCADKNLELFRLVEHVTVTRPGLVCFSCYLWNHLAICEAVTLLKRYDASLTVLVGGPEVITVDAAEQFLRKTPADIVARGEGEVTFVELLEAMVDGAAIDTVAGLTLRAGDGFRQTPSRAPLEHLDHIPSPVLTGYIDLDEFDRARPDGSIEKGRFSRYIMETYRGCYMQCSYCQWGDGDPHRYPFSLERIRAELDAILAADLRVVNFVDAMFGYKKAWAKDILRHIVDLKEITGARTAFIGYHNQDFYDEELFELYRDAGFFPEIDLQSTNPAVLNKLGRGKWAPESFERHRAAFRAHGVAIHDFERLDHRPARRQLRVLLPVGRLLPRARHPRQPFSDVGPTFHAHGRFGRG